MHDDIDSEFFEPGNNQDWDYENAVVMEGRPSRGSTFSVRFAKGEIDALREVAEANGMTTGEFIRNAALAAMAGHQPTAEEVFSALKSLAERTDTAIMLVPRPSTEPVERIA